MADNDLIRLIDADALKKDLLEQANMNEAEGNYDKAAEDRLIIDYLRLVPTIATVPVRHGCWIEVAPEGWHSKGFYCTPKIKCSKCGKIPSPHISIDQGHGGTVISYTWHASESCPSCGTKMDGGKNA